MIDPEKYLYKIDKNYSSVAQSVDRKDGMSLSFENWRFNVRMSNTEGLLRLNIETKQDEVLLINKIQELTNFILTD